MATKSITKNITFKDKTLSKNLVVALENAKKKTSKDVVIKKQCEEVKGDKIKQMFGIL